MNADKSSLPATYTSEATLHAISSKLPIAGRVAATLMLAFLFAARPALTQTTESGPSADVSSYSASLPDAPQTQHVEQATPEHVDGQSKRVFGIIPNFRAVNADVHLPPQTVREKFVTASQDSFDYSSIFVPLAVAGYDYGRNATPEFGSGGVAYGRYLWHSVVDQTSENYFVEFIVPAITHEDTRYYSLGRGGFLKRAGYSLSRAVITRSDSGGRTFNYGEVLGSGMAAGVSTLYYPSRERSFGNTGEQWGTSVAIDAAAFFVKEFSPDISHTLFHTGKIFHLPGTKSDPSS